MNLKLLSLLVFTLFYALTGLAQDLGSKKTQKIAIIFNGDDPDSESALAQTFKNNENDGVLLYMAAGYDHIIVLSKRQGNDRKATAQNLVREIEGLDNVSDLQIHFIAHGSGSPIPSGGMSGYGMIGDGSSESVEEIQIMLSRMKKQNYEYERRFTSIPLTPNESRLYSEFQAKPGKFNESKFFIATTEPFHSPETNPNVGIGDLKEALKIAKEKNPSMNTTIYTGACFSGSLARAFADTPNIQTFAASQAVLYAWGISPLEKKYNDIDGSKSDDLISYDQLFQKHLRRGENYIEAHRLALEDYLKEIRNHAALDKNLNSELSASIPRSGLQEYIINWCIKNKKVVTSDKGNCQRDSLLNYVKRNNKMVEDFYATNPEIVRCNQSVSAIEEINDKKKIIMERAFKAAKDYLEHHDGFDKAFDRILKDFEKTIEYIGQDNEKKPENAFTIKEFEKFKKMDLKARRSQMRNFHEISISIMENDYQTCVLGKNPVGIADCNPRNLAARFSQALEVWNGIDPNELKKLNKDIKVKCLKGVSSDAEGALKKINCLENESKANPIVALELIRNVTFGKSCPLFRLAALSINEDKECLEKFRMNANCSDWNRLSELVTLGTRKLVRREGDVPTSQFNSERVVR